MDYYLLIHRSHQITRHEARAGSIYSPHHCLLLSFISPSPLHSNDKQHEDFIYLTTFTTKGKRKIQSLPGLFACHLNHQEVSAPFTPSSSSLDAVLSWRAIFIEEELVISACTRVPIDFTRAKVLNSLNQICDGSVGFFLELASQDIGNGGPDSLMRFASTLRPYGLCYVCKGSGYMGLQLNVQVQYWSRPLYVYWNF
eukprot:Gb_38098 [translate_table: standard]